MQTRRCPERRVLLDSRLRSTGRGENALYIVHFVPLLARCIIYNAIRTGIRAMKLNEIGQLLKAARQKAGLTQAALADPLGMSRATISSIESGRCDEIGVTKLAALLDLVGLELTVTERRKRPTLDDLRAE